MLAVSLLSNDIYKGPLNFSLAITIHFNEFLIYILRIHIYHALLPLSN